MNDRYVWAGKPISELTGAELREWLRKRPQLFTHSVEVDGMSLSMVNPGLSDDSAVDQAGLAEIWYRIMNTAPFTDPRLGQWLRCGGESDRFPQPGFVGDRYRAKGTLLLAMNPGGKAECDTRDDYRFLEALKAMTGAATDRVSAFVELNRVFQEVAPTWRYWQVLVSPILTAIASEFPDIAYLNVLKWRHNDGVKNKREVLYDLSWKQTDAQIKLLKPSRIIVLGKGLGGWLQRRHDWTAEVIVIPRTRGDTHLAPEARNIIDQLARKRTNLPEAG